jgi:hypothetical protein
MIEMSNIQITDKEQALTNILRTTTEALTLVTAERDALKADPERYRWLMNHVDGIRRNGVHEFTVAFYENQLDNVADVDAAIDTQLQAAMKETS